MKNLIKITRFAIYILLALVFTNSCKSNKVQYEQKSCIVSHVNTSMFEKGTLLTFDDNGNLIAATPKDTLIVGVVCGEDSIFINVFRDKN